MNTMPENIDIADTPEARKAYRKNRRIVDAAELRYPVVIGPQGVIFYDPREYSSHAQV